MNEKSRLLEKGRETERLLQSKIESQDKIYVRKMKELSTFSYNYPSEIEVRAVLKIPLRFVRSPVN